MSKLVYISSPFTKGDQLVNTKFQAKIFDRLIKEGFTPIAPLVSSHLQHMFYPMSHEAWLEYDLKIVDKCDYLIRLNAVDNSIGYIETRSKGADMEEAYAKEKGIPVFYSIDDLIKGEKE